MLGCGLLPNTSMHAIEEMVVPPYLFNETLLTYRLVDSEGRVTEKEYRTHNFEGWRQRYDRVGSILSEPSLREGKVLQAHCHLIDAAALWQAALPALKQNPLYFVDAIG